MKKPSLAPKKSLKPVPKPRTKAAIVDSMKRNPKPKYDDGSSNRVMETMTDSEYLKLARKRKPKGK